MDWAAVCKLAMDKYNVEIAGGLGPTVGRVWRVSGGACVGAWAGTWGTQPSPSCLPPLGGACRPGREGRVWLARPCTMWKGPSSPDTRNILHSPCCACRWGSWATTPRPQCAWGGGRRTQQARELQPATACKTVAMILHEPA